MWSFKTGKTSGLPWHLLLKTGLPVFVRWIMHAVHVDLEYSESMAPSDTDKILLFNPKIDQLKWLFVHRCS